MLPERVSELLVPLRELVESLSIRDRLPQIEVAVADRADGTQIVLVLRVLNPPDDADRARLLEFARHHEVEFWLQPGGPQTAAPLSPQQPTELQLNLPEFGVTVPFGPTDFTQVNHRINQALVRRALRLLDPQPHEKVVDFFCGLGNFTLPLATRAAHVLGHRGQRNAGRTCPRRGAGQRAGRSHVVRGCEISSNGRPRTGTAPARLPAAWTRY